MLNLIVFAQRKFADLKDDCRGVTAMEYGLIAAFTVAAIGATIATIGGSLTTIWSGISTKLSTAGYVGLISPTIPCGGAGRTRGQSRSAPHRPTGRHHEHGVQTGAMLRLHFFHDASPPDR